MAFIQRPSFLKSVSILTRLRGLPTLSRMGWTGAGPTGYVAANDCPNYSNSRRPVAATEIFRPGKTVSDEPHQFTTQSNLL